MERVCLRHTEEADCHMLRSTFPFVTRPDGIDVNKKINLFERMLAVLSRLFRVRLN